MLEVRDLSVRFGSVTAVDGVSFAVPDGPFGLGVVGESGSGKTTIARALVRLTQPSGGAVELDGADVLGFDGAALKEYRKRLQIVFQDPDSTLNPRMRVGASVAEVLRAHALADRAGAGVRVAELLAEVGLDPQLGERFPHQLSGGQRQRVAIARALAVEPDIVVLDEPTSALDVTVQAHVLDLIGTLREERRLAYVLISHNLAVVERLCEQTLVLYLGRVVERGPTPLLLSLPAHPYTRALRAAVPALHRELPPARTRAAAPPDPAAPPPGCPFHPRCPMAVERCGAEVPELRAVADRLVACHRAEDALAEDGVAAA
jgi:oligopeptide/dipeptide ABC transporter ATP-binding protein